ncbi:thioredoxin family protein [Oryzobacter sp. R7]|uniref:DF family (seleno)protein n=1 Tax=Oryzobacter faecalis TaxID=3388656 RepID=UPI00398CFA83
MEVRLLYFEGCPHWTVADERLRAAMAQIGDTSLVHHVLIETPEDAAANGFVGSPTIQVDGRDPFARGDEQVGLTCRLYSTPEGLAGSPTVAQLIEVLS